MATSDVHVTCDGASGTAAAFVVMIRANGQELTQEQVTGQPVPRTGGDPWHWSFRWTFEGHQVVDIWDVTHDGAETHLVGYYPVDCPLPSTTTMGAPTTAPTTSEPMASIPQLVVDSTVESTVGSTVPYVQHEQQVETSVALTLPGAPTTATVQAPTQNTLPATGSDAAAMFLPWGFGFLAVGAALLVIRRAVRPPKVVVL